MKSTTKWLVTAAALAIATGVASAQALQAEIPFAFRAGDKMMAAGTYNVKSLEGQRYLILSNFEARQSVILLPNSLETPAKATAKRGEPVMVFECGSRCELIKVWTGSGYPEVALRRHAPSGGETASLMEIRLVRVNGD